VPLRARSPRLPRVVAPLVVSAILAIAIGAVGASGAERPAPSSLPDSVFHPVELAPRGASTLGAAASVAEPLRSAAPGEVAVIRDPWVASPPPARAQPKLPGSKPLTVVTAKPTTHRIVGAASYYCRAGSSPCTINYPDGSGFDAYAAAGPRLRAALGAGWRGKVVLVDGIRVKLIDWCQCYQGEPNEKLLDLYYDVFARTGSSVTIRW
jgi:hypothetical protein